MTDPADTPAPPADLPTGLAVDALLDLHHPIKHAASDWAADQLSQHDMVTADRESTFAADDWQRC